MAYTTTPEDNEAIANLPGDIRAVTATVTAHTEAESGAHQASAISFGSGNVEAALEAAAGHEADKNNPHGVTTTQIGALEAADAVATISAGKVVRRDANGKVAGDITGNAATATTSGAITSGGHIITPSWDGTEINFQVDSTADLPVHNAMLLQGKTLSQVVNNSSYYSGSTQTGYSKPISAPSWITTVAGGGNIDAYYEYVNTGIGAGTYSLQSIVQALINLAHSHTTLHYYSNCNCNCNCCRCGGA